jgi:hypothetical protein
MSFLFRYSYPLQIGFILVMGIISILATAFFNEVIPVCGGFGFDGEFFGKIAQDYPANITKTIDSKYFQRSLPSLIVYSVATVFNIATSKENIIILFSSYNLALLLICVTAWRRIVKLFELLPYVNWLGFAALFINFSSLKFPFFYPVLTDLTGFTLSVLLIPTLKTNNKVAVLLIMLLGAVTWPAIGYICVVILLFNNVEIVREERYNKINTFIAFLVAFMFAGLAGYLIYRHPHMRGGWLEHTYIVKNGIIPSLMATFLVVFFSVQKLIKGVNFYSLAIFRAVDFKYGVIGIVLFLAIDVIGKFLSNKYNIHSGYSIRMYLNDILIIGSRQPFCFILGHFVYFGPLFVICLLKWEKMCHIIHKMGWKMFLIMAQFLFFMMDSESRHIIGYIPFLTIILVQLFSAYPGNQFLITVLVLSFVFSKSWAPMRTFPFSDWMENYTMNFGCYFSDAIYIFYLVIFSVIAFIFHKLLQNKMEIKVDAGKG